MFRGNHPAKVDEKGRLKLPSAFKQLVDAANVTQFYVTSSDGKSAEIWPLPEWEKREEQLAEASTMDDAVEKYLNLTSYYGQQVEMDNQARILLPQILRGTAKLDAEVAVLGKMHYLEVHNREASNRSLPANALTAEDRKATGDDSQAARVEPPPYPSGGAHDEVEVNAMCRFFYKKRLIFSGCGRAPRWWTARWAWPGTPQGLQGCLEPQGHLIGFDRDPEALAAGQGDSWIGFAGS